MQVRMSLRDSDRAHCEACGNEQMGDDAFHGVSPVGRRVSHESNVRNGSLTSIDELLPDDVPCTPGAAVPASGLNGMESLRDRALPGDQASVTPSGSKRMSGAHVITHYICVIRVIYRKRHVSPESRFKRADKMETGARRPFSKRFFARPVSLRGPLSRQSMPSCG
jgi:hypothetical protein